MKHFNYEYDAQKYWDNNRDFHIIDTVPSDEKCIPAGEDYEREQQEARTFIDQLKREFPNTEKYDIELEAVSCPHDFGNYMQILVSYNTDNQKSVNYALKIVDHLPLQWDDKSQAALLRTFIYSVTIA